MPELPEAETIARGLRPSLAGRTLRALEVVHEDVLPQGTETVRAAIRGRRIDEVGRRGKNLVLLLADAAGAEGSVSNDTVLLINLGMTGRLVVLPARPESGAPSSASDSPPAAPPSGEEEPPDRPTHPALRFLLDDGATLVYDDIRRFGRVEALDGDEWRERSRALGPEPLDPALEPGDLADRLGSSRSPIRNVLLDQSRIAGVGNIYANEALHRATIHPRRPADSLEKEDFGRLLAALRDLLAAAIGAGGTTIRDYRDASGRPGRYSRQLQVYDREGHACGRCGESIERIIFGNRSAFLCPRCQPAGPEGGGR
ncbi:MAG: bifunctional DNA-formamidopyrimidine glycosylase/DNA-(apurinic or apyrimidinic site) lyase [bacterium]